LTDDEHMARSRTVNAAGMEYMDAELRTLGFKPVPSEANFLYFDVGRDGRQVFEALLREGVIVRHIEGTMLRVTIGRDEENRACVAALRRVLTS
jgi:histidinol-phosphate aminotransferase